MYTPSFEKHFNKMQSIIYKKIKNDSFSEKEILNISKKHIKSILFLNLRYTIIFNSLIKLKKENMFLQILIFI